MLLWTENRENAIHWVCNSTKYTGVVNGGNGWKKIGQTMKIRVNYSANTSSESDNRE